VITMANPRVLNAYVRADGAVAARNHVLLLPVVVCSTLVSREVAEATGAVAMVHPHGCGHIGDDVDQSIAIYAGMAANPNVAACVVVSLGCETVQGTRVEEAVRALGVRTARIGIQDSGGAGPAAADARDLVRDLQRETDIPRTSEADFHGLVVGVDIARPSQLLMELAAALLLRGARVVAVDRPGLAWELPEEAIHVGIGEAPAGRVTLVPDSGPGSRGLTALAVSRCAVIVSATAESAAPVSFPAVPVINVASAAPLHSALSEDFDVSDDDSVDVLLTRIEEVLAGALTATESRPLPDIVMPRLRRSM